MRKIIFAIIFFGMSVNAATVDSEGCEGCILKTLTWNPPTTRTDGSAIKPGELIEYRLRCGPVDESDMLLSIFTPQERPTDSIEVYFEPGEWKCRLRTRNAAGLSEWSESAFFTVTAAPEPVTVIPNPPTGLMLADG